jgi:hypothetical protein
MKGESIRRVSAIAVCVALVALAAPVFAGVCGDDVQGRRVACECGDTVVSSTRLRGTDPVASAQCSNDGLLVDAAAGAPGLVLDLAGQTIKGAGRGYGIRVLDGGEQGVIIAGGSTVLPATVASFRVGISARGKNALSEVVNVVVTGCKEDGIVLHTAGGTVEGVIVERNGRDGIRVSGRAQTLDGVLAAENARDGFRLSGKDNRVTGGAQANGRSNTVSNGRNQVGVVTEVRP